MKTLQFYCGGGGGEGSGGRRGEGSGGGEGSDGGRGERTGGGRGYTVELSYKPHGNRKWYSSSYIGHIYRTRTILIVRVPTLLRHKMKRKTELPSRHYVFTTFYLNVLELSGKRLSRRNVWTQ